jgi:hypothetical protein
MPIEIDNFPDLIYVHNKKRVNDRWSATPHAVIEAFSADSKLKNFIDNTAHMSIDYLLQQQAFVHVVTETVFNYPVPFITEKTFKPIANKRPFVIVGASGSVANLRALGFKTFNNYWDEGYDSIEDPNQRLAAIVEVVKFICSHSISELQNLCVDMEEVLNYNFTFYVNEFRNQELKKFEQACINNLLKR